MTWLWNRAEIDERAKDFTGQTIAALARPDEKIKTLRPAYLRAVQAANDPKPARNQGRIIRVDAAHPKPPAWQDALPPPLVRSPLYHAVG
jgi:hypothetical protein